jgi:ribosomal protein L7/L12
MNENKPNWVDKASLASSLVQNIQLKEVHSTLRALGDLQAQKIHLDLNEQQVREREERLRDHVWQMEQAFESVLRDTSTTPSAIHVLAKQVLDGMARYRVTTASFRQFNDKDRLGQFLHKLQRSIEDSTAKMSSEQLSDTERFLRYQSERQELSGLIENLQIENQKKSEKIKKNRKRKDTAVAKLEGLRMKVGTPEAKMERLGTIGRISLAKVGVVILAAPAAIAWLSLIFFLGVPIYGFLGDRNDPEDGTTFALGIGILFLAIVLTALSIVLHSKSQLPKSIEEQIAHREKEIRDADVTLAKLEQIGPRDGEFKRFEAKDLNELIQQQSERESFMLQFRQVNHHPLDSFPEKSQKQQGGALMHEMSPEVQELARRADKKISAIKLYKEQTGVSLTEAKSAVEAFFDQVHSDD